MIAKGTTHNNGAKLARYMTTGKENERAELWQLTGFAAGDIRDAFRSVHVMAEATRCEHPFFHCQIRNPDGEELTREQWRRVADRIETKLGLTDQPRAIAFHIDENTGHEHMHLAWSRINGETMRAVPLPFFKERLKEECRLLEKELDLTRVTSERHGAALAPTRDEFEQARRLGVDIHAVRNTIRDCFERSDNGRSFEAALADHGLLLAQGDRRDFVVIDHENGIHALGKRILGVTAGQTRDRLADLDRDELPSVEQARSFVREQQLGRENTKSEPMRDPHRDEMAWQDRLAQAAIEKEKIEGRFVEPGRQQRDPGNRFLPPIYPPHPSLNITPPELWIEDAAHEVSHDRRSLNAPRELQGKFSATFKDLPDAGHIWEAFHRNGHNPNAFAQALDNHGILLASATKEEAERSRKERGISKESGHYSPVLREGEIVAIGPSGRVHKLNDHTTGQDRAEIERFMKKLDRGQVQGIQATIQIMHERAGAREAYAYLQGIVNPVTHRRETPLPDNIPKAVLSAAGRQTVRQVDKTLDLASTVIKSPLAPEIASPLGKAGRQAGKALDMFGKALESVLAPVLTPEQKREGARTQAVRAADAADKIDLSQYLADLELRRQRQEREQETTRQRDTERER
jgi:hypothetical protein